MFTLDIQTSKEKEVYDLTDDVNSLLKKSPVDEGLCTVFVKHTTAALTVADMDPGAEEDYLKAFEKLIPDINYKHPHDPDHMPDHIMGALMNPSISIPIDSSQLDLGTWQRLVLMDFSGPRKRTVRVIVTKGS